MCSVSAVEESVRKEQCESTDGFALCVCVCRVSVVEKIVRKEQCESTDGLVCVQGVSSGGECEKRAV